MVHQLSLWQSLDDDSSQNSKEQPVSNDRYRGALLLSAIGDSLGWPTEFLKPDLSRRPRFQLPLRQFVKWEKSVGGKWWGYTDRIYPGEYSDDTQLTLSVARCINDRQDFQVDRFSYEELPLWLQYERGGGSSVKTAANYLVRRNANWMENFYSTKSVNYFNAGANGAAMRNLPIALVCHNNRSKLISNSLLNSIITHGHPRALIAAILYGLAVKLVLNSANLAHEEFAEKLINELSDLDISSNDTLGIWIQNWDRYSKIELVFGKLFNQTQLEAIHYLRAINDYMGSEPSDYYDYVGARKPETKGSGISTVCAAIYLYLRYADKPMEAVYQAANLYGSDTDTIGSFVGALVGSHHGTGIIPDDLKTAVQDSDYLNNVADYLHRLASSVTSGAAPADHMPDASSIRLLAYSRIAIWEDEFQKMFRDELPIGEYITHPSLGKGRIVSREVSPIRGKPDYVAKLIRVKFDVGQTCVFHSRVKGNSEVAASLSKEIQKATR